MNLVSVENYKILEDPAARGEFRKIDLECSSCMYEAGKIAVEDVLWAVIRDELTEQEQKTVILAWFKNEKTSRIAAELGCSAEKVRSCLKKAKSKIYGSLKYVVLYDNILGGRDKLPKDFHFKIVNCINGKELLS
ncbi:MAG: hypothetical protein LUG85_02075 [Clostridiales bacterium]|nr:hypothetical protein [Clostridiales bacterium]